MNQGLESTVDPNANKYVQQGAGGFGFGGKAAPFQRYKECKYNKPSFDVPIKWPFPFIDIQNVGDNLGAVYRARTGKSSAAYDPFSASSPQYQPVQSYLQNRSNVNNNNSSNYSPYNNTSPSYNSSSSGNFSFGGTQPSYGSTANANPFGPPQPQQQQQQAKPATFSFGTANPAPSPPLGFGTVTSSPPGFGAPSTVAVKSSPPPMMPPAAKK